MLIIEWIQINNQEDFLCNLLILNNEDKTFINNKMGYKCFARRSLIRLHTSNSEQLRQVWTHHSYSTEFGVWLNVNPIMVSDIEWMWFKNSNIWIWTCTVHYPKSKSWLESICQNKTIFEKKNQTILDSLDLKVDQFDNAAQNSKI